MKIQDFEADFPRLKILKTFTHVNNTLLSYFL